MPVSRGAPFPIPVARPLSAAMSLVFLLLVGCAGTSGPPPLKALDRPVDLERFMGDWYVIGFIPISLPFFSEANAHNGIESYRLADDGSIEVTYTFRDGAFDGRERRFTPKAWVHDTTTNAEWRIRFVWPFKAAYLIAHLDEDYQRTIIGVPDRGNVWLLTRTPDVSDAEYEALRGIAGDLGYDVEKIQRVPQRWPAD
jgi:apolipoprotein D and lipocalin family protein